MKLYKYFMAAVVMAAVLTGCRTRVDPYYPRENQRPGTNQGGNGNQDKPQQEKDPELQENTTWKITYEGRKVVNGVYTDEISVNNVSATQKYLVSVISRAKLDTYGADYLAFFKHELEQSPDYIYQGAPEVIEFERLRHGQWFGFVIGLDGNNKLTGEYACTVFYVDEEEASDEYNNWIGEWTVSDGTISYDISISKVEANLVYLVKKWEVRPNAPSDWVQMDLEYLEAFFEPSNGRLYFVSQYIATYDDEDLNGATVDELFLGQIDYTGIQQGYEMGLYIVPEEGIDLAYAEEDSEGKVFIHPCDIEVNVGKDKFIGKFNCMQYVYQEVKSGEWHVYNQNVARFADNVGSPILLSMVKTNAGAVAPTSIVKRNGKLATIGEEKPLRGKVYQPREGRVATAVKL